MAINTLTDAAGGFVVDPIFRADVEALVYARPVFLQLATVFPVNRREVRLHHIATKTNPAFIAEIETKPEGNLTFGRDTMRVEECAEILVWSDRLTEESFAQPGIRAIVRREIVNVATDKIDKALFDGMPSTDTDPNEITGLLQQSASFQTLAYGTEADLGEDIRRALRLVRGENFEPNVVVMHSTALDLLLSIRTTDDQLKYPTVNSPAPTIWGKPIVTSNNIPTLTVTDGEQSDVIVGDFSRINVATMPSSILISNVATVGGTSLFETDQTAIRWVGNISSPLVRTPHLNAIAIIQNVDSP